MMADAETLSWVAFNIIKPGDHVEDEFRQQSVSSNQQVENSK